MLRQRYLFLCEGFRQLAHAIYLELCTFQRPVTLVRTDLIDPGSLVLLLFTFLQSRALHQLTCLLNGLDLERTRISLLIMLQAISL